MRPEKKTRHEDPRSGRKHMSYRRSSSDDSERHSFNKSKKEYIDRERGQPRSHDSNSKETERKLHRSHSRSLSSDSDRRVKYFSHHSNQRSKKSRRSSSSEKIKSKKENRVKSRRRRKSSSSSSKSSSSSDSSSKSGNSSSSDESSESHSSSNPSVSNHSSVTHKRKVSQSRTPSKEHADVKSVKNNDRVAMPFKNDGSFLEMFKKMQESKSTDENVIPSAATAEVTQPPKKPVMPLIMKRRGGRLLKTGLVKKPKAIEEQHAGGIPKDAWSLYMQEVKKYRETSCEEEGKTRPLVK